MKSLSNDARTIFVDLPGHGKSQVHAKHECTIFTEEQRVVLVGYSMGARIALHMALNSDKIKGAVIISGSPGLKEESNRKIHQAIDKSRAKLLISHGLHNFLETWYSTKLCQGTTQVGDL
ncbi:protein PHYLLO, chloroplastic-like [Carex rostrata]